MLSMKERGGAYILFVAIAVVTLYPISILVSTALTPSNSLASDTISFNHALSVEAFAKAWSTGNFSTTMVNSVIVAVAVVAISTVVAILAAYAIETLKPVGSAAVLVVAILGFLLPVEALIVPWYYELEPAGLINSYWAIILPQAAQSIAFGVFWLAVAMRSLPKSLSEAAVLDGASRWTLLWQVLVPNISPAIRTMIALVFLWTWNAFLLPLVVVSRSERYTVTVGISVFQGARGNDFALLAAASVLAALPVVIVYLFAQRSFIAGMLAGSTVG